MSTKNQQNSHACESFKKASKIVSKSLSLEQLTELWNKQGLGKPAKQTTVKRWLDLGPATKNVNFEPWIIGLSNSAVAMNNNVMSSKFVHQSIKAHQSMKDNGVWFAEKLQTFRDDTTQMLTQKQRSFIGSLKVYLEDKTPLSTGQIKIAKDMYEKLINKK